MKILGEPYVLLEQRVCVVALDELEHLDEMLVVVERREWPRPASRNPVSLVERHRGEAPAEARRTIAAAVFLKSNEWIGSVAYQ